MREERALDRLRERLAAVAGIARVEIDPTPEHQDEGPFPAIGILPGDTSRAGERQQAQLKVILPVTVRLVTDEDPTVGNFGLTVNPRTAGYKWMQTLLSTLWPGQNLGTYTERLGGFVMQLHYVSHTIYPKENGGVLSAAYIDAELEYVLHLDDPEQ